MKYPPGKIHVIKSNGSVQYYLRTKDSDKSGKYIPKKNQEKIRNYLQKRYDEKAYNILKNEKNNLEKLLKKSNKQIDRLQDVYSNNPEEIKNLITPIDVPDEDYVNEWINQSYKGKNIAEEATIFVTNRGERVRSKSELTIANMLEKYNIPYKYECPFILYNGNVIYPDFTILDIKSRREMYWEHRGMMDDREYARHAVQRVKQLAKSGVQVGHNLILTEETMNYPLGTDEIEAIILYLHSRNGG